MKRYEYIAYSGIIIAAILLVLASVSAHARSEFSGKVVRVADGDTITVLAPGNQQVKVRLYGIDCPERKQAFGQRARQFTASRVAGENVRVQVSGGHPPTPPREQVDTLKYNLQG